MRIFLVRFDSESGDHFTIGAYQSAAAPTQGQLDQLAREQLEGYVEDGLLYGSFDVEEIAAEALPFPAEDPAAEPLRRL